MMELQTIGRGENLRVLGTNEAVKLLLERAMRVTEKPLESFIDRILAKTDEVLAR